MAKQEDITTQISKLLEDDLRDKVLIPMFKALGAVKVRKKHGPNEKGKDVYFAYRDIVGSHKHCCLLIKAGNITKSGRGDDVGVVERQIKEALFFEFVDPFEKKRKAYIEEFYLVCNGEVKDQAEEYFYEMMKKHAMPNVRIVELEDIVNIIIDQIIHPYNIETQRGYVFNVSSFSSICEDIYGRSLKNRQTTKLIISEDSKILKK